jgi:hypothetical protein
LNCEPPQASMGQGIGWPADKRASHALPRRTLGTAREADLADDQSEKRGATGFQVNAFTGALAPKWDLVGPTVDDDIRRATLRYGPEAVKSAVKEATKAKRGRPREPDWPELRDVIKADALEWLAGGDPFSARSNYAIAKDFAERNPGHSVVSTHKRIERKLSRGPYDRRWFTLVTAENLSRDQFPYGAHVRALEAIASLPDIKTANVWQTWLERARSTIADYEVREGKPPDPLMPFKQIEEAVRNGGLAALIAAPSQFGLPSPAGTLLGKILSEAVKAPED